MELASMLAGEEFSDDPSCVDGVVGAYLRAFNDRLDHRRRQDLRPYAAAVVGTNGSRSARRARRQLCFQYASGSPHGGPFVRARLFMLIGGAAALDLDLGAAEWAAREAIARGDAEGGFALLDALLGDRAPQARQLVVCTAPPPTRRTLAGAPLEAAPLALPVARAAQLRVPALAADLVFQPHGAQEQEGGERGDDGAGRRRFRR
jgi:hypothetical protein